VKLVDFNPLTFGVGLGNVARAEDHELHEVLEYCSLGAKRDSFGG
jgi:hypothetical protein